MGMATRLKMVAALGVAVIAACSNPFSADDGTHIRLRNSSAFVLTAVKFQPGEPELEFSRIEPGEATDYVAVDNAYSYGYLEVTVNGARRVIQPIDYVGESYIGDGRFTYVITIEPGTLNPNTTLVKDD